jgi:hypothetical protein
MVIQENKNIFLYGCCASPSDSSAAKVNSIIKTFPFLLSQQNKHFSYKDCKFSAEKEKEAAARMVVFKELGIVNSYT